MFEPLLLVRACAGSGDDSPDVQGVSGRFCKFIEHPSKGEIRVT